MNKKLVMMNGTSGSCSLRSLKNATDILIHSTIYCIQNVKVWFFNAFVVLLKVSPKKCHRIKCLLYVFSRESSNLRSKEVQMLCIPRFWTDLLLWFRLLATLLTIGRLLIARRHCSTSSALVLSLQS